MPAFAFTARSAGGRAVRGLRVVASEGALGAALASEGLFLVRAEPARAAVPAKVRLKPGDLGTFLLHLVAYLEAGLPLLAAFQDYREPGRPALEAAVQAMAAELAEGASLSAIMAGRPQLFEAMHVGMVRAGEATGRLDQALRAVIQLLDWEGRFRAQVRQASLYPLVLLAVLTATILLVSAFSLPPILGLLGELNVPLPGVTRVFLVVGRMLGRYGWLLVAVPVLARAGLKAALGHPGFRLRWDTALLALPVAGPLVLRLALARFAHFFAAQHRAGLPMVEALRHSEAVTGNARVGQAIRALRLGVEQGGGLAVTASRTGLFPQLVIRMLAIGEATGALEETLERAAGRFDAEAAEGVRVVFAVLDPAIKIVMAGLLVFVAVSVLLPLYTLIGGING